MQPDLAEIQGMNSQEKASAPGATETASGTTRFVKWIVIAWVLGIAAFHLACAAKGKSFYRDIHLGTALEYYKGSINLLKPIIVGFNLNRAPTPQELPVWQAAAGLAFKVFGPWFGWANLVSVLCFVAGLYPLYQLAERYAGAGAGWWSLLLFVAQPLVFTFAGLASPDGLSMVAAIWFLYYAMRLREGPTAGMFVATVLTGALAAVCKLPFFFAAGAGCAVLVLKDFRDAKKAIVWLGLAAMIIGALFYAWTKYTDYCNSLAELPLVDLRASTSGMKEWYFGSLSYRLNPGIWVKGGFRILTGTFGSMSVAGLLVLGLVWRRPSRLAFWWLAGCLLSTFIFFHLVLTHWHYYLMFAPPVAILCGQAAMNLEGAVAATGLTRRWLNVLLIAGALGLGTIQGLYDSHAVIHFDTFPNRMADLVKQHTAASEKVLMRGGGWGGEVFFLAGRDGLSIWDTKPLEDPATYARLKSLGYTKLVMISEAPLLTAIRDAYSPNARLERESYKISMTPIVDTLPTVLQSEDILIKELK